MIVITSGAYVAGEFQAECGRLPPAMLPLGNRRLFEHQVAFLRTRFAERAIHLSLPAGYEVPAKDARTLARLGVAVVAAPEGLSLGESLIHVLDATEASGPLAILHGDTLVEDFPAGDDVIGVVRTREDYAWEIEQVGATGETVWCGYFHLADAAALRRWLAVAGGSFVEALRGYDRERGLERVEIAGWHDLGHINTFFKARASRTTQRAFNTLAIADGCVVKSGQPAQKISAEAGWFAALPPALRRHAPQLIDRGSTVAGEPYYVLEYLCLLPLNELYVHGCNPVFFWDRVFGHCALFFDGCRRAYARLAPPGEAAIAENSRALVAAKSWRRLDDFAAARGVSLDAETRLNGVALPSLRTIAGDCIARTLAGAPVPAIVHGDFCFSNLLFDPRGEAIKVIDPRGMDQSGAPTLFGDLRYDLAKLTHSVVGLYDYILAGAFEGGRVGALDFEFDVPVDARTRDVQKVFRQRRYIDGSGVDEVMPLVVLLFLSMLPLHAESAARQDALLANALRLYRDMAAGR